MHNNTCTVLLCRGTIFWYWCTMNDFHMSLQCTFLNAPIVTLWASYGFLQLVFVNVAVSFQLCFTQEIFTTNITLKLLGLTCVRVFNFVVPYKRLDMFGLEITLWAVMKNWIWLMYHSMKLKISLAMKTFIANSTNVLIGLLFMYIPHMNG